MMDFNERVIPGVSANFLYQEAFARYVFARKIVGRGKKIIDVGCGTGYGTNYLSFQNSVFGLDRDKDAIKFAKKHFPEITFECNNIESFSPTDEFNAVVAFEIIEHLKHQSNFLIKLKELSTKDCVFVFSTPNTRFPSPPNSTKSIYHTKEFTQDEFIKILQKHFSGVTLYGQSKDTRAKQAFEDFLKSQEARTHFISRDVIGIRRIIPKEIKEYLWKYLGSFFGRKTQDSLTYRNFPISKSIENAEYFIAVCHI